MREMMTKNTRFRQEANSTSARKSASTTGNMFLFFIRNTFVIDCPKLPSEAHCDRNGRNVTYLMNPIIHDINDKTTANFK